MIYEALRASISLTDDGYTQAAMIVRILPATRAIDSSAKARIDYLKEHIETSAWNWVRKCVWLLQQYL
jgi:hypothetical protein